MKALIIGATGVTGKDLVETLLRDGAYSQVVSFVRRVSGKSYAKLREIVTDFDRLDEVAEHIDGDILFSLLGTTLKVAGSKEMQRHIDYDIPLKFAEIAKQNQVYGIVLLSAYGASAKSNVFYSKIKGELEEAISKLAFEQYIVFRPGALVRKDSDRWGEKIAIGVLDFVNSLGILKKFRPLPTATLAEKLAKAPKKLTIGTHFIPLDQIFSF